MEPFNNPSTEKPQRTFLLWFLAICTMINAGMNVFSFSMYAFFPNFIQQSMEVVKNIPAFNNAQYQETLELFLTIPQWKFGLLILAEAAAFAGALIMLVKLNPIGFHIYTISQILEFCTLNFIIGEKLAMNFSSVILTMLIIVMYASQLRYMKNKDTNETTGSQNEDYE